MENQEKLIKAYDSITLSEEEKQKLADKIENGSRRRRPKIARWTVKAAGAVAALAVIFGLANIVTYACAKESLIHVITKAVSGVESSGLFGENSDKEYISEGVYDINEAFVYDEYEFLVEDYLYDSYMETLYLSMRIKNLNGDKIKISGDTRTHDYKYMEAVGGKNVNYVCLNIEGENGTISCYLINNSHVRYVNGESDDEVYVYVVSEEIKDRPASICVTAATDEDIRDNVVYTFKPYNNSYGEIYTMKYSGVEIAISPFKIRMESDDGITIRDMTIYYTDGSKFTALKDGEMAMTNGSSAYGIDEKTPVTGYDIVIDDVRKVSDIDYIEIDGERIELN